VTKSDVRYRIWGEGEHRMRMKVVLNEGHEGFIARWTDSCTGCFEFNEGWGLSGYSVDPKHKCYIGSGCDECGYTGKVRHAMWIPFDMEAWDKHANADWYEEQRRRAQARAEGLTVMS